MPQTRALEYADFTGGLNLRADSQQISRNESPKMLNVDVDPRGGFASRSGFEDWKTFSPSVWDPRELYIHKRPDGTEIVLLANDNKVYESDGGGAITQLVGPTPAADPHEASFASWGDDVFIACGTGQAAYRRNGSDDTVTVMADPVSVGWNNDPLVPGTNKMPRGEFVASHLGYLWVANILDHPDRVHVSFPNDPDSWAENDFIDFPEGGGPITALVPYRDHLLVFFPNSVHAIYGNSPTTFQKAEVSTEWGAVNGQCVTKSGSSVYFVSWPEGVFEISAEQVREVSMPLRPALRSDDFLNDTSLMWLGWADQRLWWTVPYNTEQTPTGAEAVFVMDPTLAEGGSWTLYRSGCGCAVGPVATSEVLDGALGATRFGASLLRLDTRPDLASDLVLGVEYTFDTYFVTPWVWGTREGDATLKKRWKRPDLIVKEEDSTYTIDMYVYHDYDEANAVRTRQLSVSAGSAGTVWTADPDWDGTDGSLTTPGGLPAWTENNTDLWGLSAEGSTIERSGSLGTARSVQIEFHGEHGKSWGVNNITYKYVPRRLR